MYGDGPEAGLEATYLNWRDGEPDNWDNMEHCVRVAEGEWGDTNCNYNFWFVVEFECPPGQVLNSNGEGCRRKLDIVSSA